MNVGKLKLYPVAVLVWAATFYMLVVGIHDWHLWVSIVFLFLERLLAQITLWVAMYAFKSMATSVGTMLKEAGIDPHAKRD